MDITLLIENNITPEEKEFVNLGINPQTGMKTEAKELYFIINYDEKYIRIGHKIKIYSVFNEVETLIDEFEVVCDAKHSTLVDYTGDLVYDADKRSYFKEYSGPTITEYDYLRTIQTQPVVMTQLENVYMVTLFNRGRFNKRPQ